MKNKNDIFLLGVVLFIILTIISFIIALVVIWSPSNKGNGVNTYTYSGFESKVVTMYQKQLQVLLKESNIKRLVDRLDDEFLNQNNLSKQDISGIKRYLDNKELLATNRASITGYTVSENKDTGVLVYKFKYYNKYGFERYVNLIETEPYIYTLSFTDEFTSTSAKKNIVDSYEKIKFEISLQESTIDSLKYNIKITNNNEKIVKLDFNSVSSVELKLKDDTSIKLASVVATNDDEYTLRNNSYLNQELFFNIPLEKQGDIKSIIFYNVVIGDDTKNLSIDF